MFPPGLRNGPPDPRHFHRRRLTRRYRAKQRIVKNVWIVAGCIMLCLPSLALILAGALFTTILSFLILDETN